LGFNNRILYYQYIQHIHSAITKIAAAADAAYTEQRVFCTLVKLS